MYEWLVNAMFSDKYLDCFINACVYVPIALVTSWFTINVVIRGSFLQQKRTRGWILLFLSAAVFTFIRRLGTYYIVYRRPSAESYWNMPFIHPKIIIEFVWLYLVVGFSVMLYFMKAWYEQQRISEMLKKDKVVAQLELLKSQVHPHFIFNTLNNIYALSLQQDPKTPDLIHRLSALLSYMLYDSKDTYIPVSKEIEYLYNYIELQKIRYSDRLDISVNIFGPLDNFSITPLLLLPLLENSFKHGISNEAEKGWIRIDLSRSDDWLVVKMENSLGTETNGESPLTRHNGSVSSGIGLANVRRRLEILYPGRHEFRTLSDPSSYLAILKIRNQYEDNLSYSG